jgi:hypothetical protein
MADQFAEEPTRALIAAMDADPLFLQLHAVRKTAGAVLDAIDIAIAKRAAELRDRIANQGEKP